MAQAPTTIRSVTILRGPKRAKRDVFDLDLSTAGIQVRRPGRSPQHMSWERVTQWEIEERRHDIVLTLRGGGAVTPLVIRGWTLDDLAELMRAVTSGPSTAQAASASPAGAPAAPPPTAMPTAPPPSASPPAPPAPAPAAVPPDQVAAAAPPRRPAAAQPGASGHRARRRGRSPLGWRPVVTVALLTLAAVAVALVLLQSAGVISWGFLGPTS